MAWGRVHFQLILFCVRTIPLMVFLSPEGFADIPSGRACPYVLRRGLLGTDAMPLPRRETTPQEEDDDIEP